MSLSQWESENMVPTIHDIQAAHLTMGDRILRTPVIPLRLDSLGDYTPSRSSLHLKLELFQQAGSFKARGALLGVERLSEGARTAGVVTASGGNHALAVSWAAKAAGVSAKVVMPQTADSVRILGCQALGAEVILVDRIALVFDKMNEIAEREGRTVLHPFDAEHMVLGAATCGAEFAADAPPLDVLVVPVGGGGLISGLASAFRRFSPTTEIYGVEPFGAATLYQSMQEGKPVAPDKLDSIADSLSAPRAMPYTFAIVRELVREIVLVTDDELRACMRLLHHTLKLTAEPACAASLAAVLGPLRDRCEGRSVGVMGCGSNISLDRFSALIG